jgi:hypothetical protein
LLSQDPRCAELEKFLRALEPQQERTSELLSALWPYDESELAALMRASRVVAEGLRRQLNTARPKLA